MSYIAEPKLELEDIKRLLPHRYPFLLIDRVIEWTPGKKGTAIKNVTCNEPYFQGHFPEEAVMPGVLIVEACGQLAGIVMDRTNKQDIQYLASIQKFNFKHKVIPGDQLILEVFNFKPVQKLLQVNVKASVKNQLVAEGILVLTAF